MTDLSDIAAALAQATPTRPLGRITALSGARVSVTGLSASARLGDLVTVLSHAGARRGEVISIDDTSVRVLADAQGGDLAMEDRVVLDGPARISPSDDWLGRIVDPRGQPLDGGATPVGGSARALISSPPPAVGRRPMGARLRTGIAILDLLAPLVQGQRLGIFASAGVGKSTLIGRLARTVPADVVVVGLVGERGREVGTFVNRTLDPATRQRTVVIAATADRSALVRRQAAFTATTVAESFRDQGKHVLLLIDSLTRTAEAHREIALAAGESPALRGHPASLVPLLAGLAERTGPGSTGGGDITAIFSVLVAGDDRDEPVADTLRGQLDGHVVLSREIAEQGRFPAIDILRSVSRALPDAAGPGEQDLIDRARAVLTLVEKNEPMIRAGLYQPGSDARLDAALSATPALDRLFAGRTAPTIEESFAALAEALPVSDQTSDSTASNASEKRSE